jgi:hypothetical protein
LTSPLTQERIAEHQIAFRRSNNRIYRTADRLALTTPIPFICECADTACTEIVQLSSPQYQAVRRHPRGFFNISGHEAPSVEAGAERIVAVISDFTMVVKIGVAGEFAAEACNRN